MTDLLIAGAILVTATYGTYSLFARRYASGVLSFAACSCLVLSLLVS
jgi:hypothetical protein